MPVRGHQGEPVGGSPKDRARAVWRSEEWMDGCSACVEAEERESSDGSRRKQLTRRLNSCPLVLFCEQGSGVGHACFRFLWPPKKMLTAEIGSSVHVLVLCVGTGREVDPAYVSRRGGAGAGWGQR